MYIYLYTSIRITSKRYIIKLIVISFYILHIYISFLIILFPSFVILLLSLHLPIIIFLNNESSTWQVVKDFSYRKYKKSTDKN